MGCVPSKKRDDRRQLAERLRVRDANDDKAYDDELAMLKASTDKLEASVDVLFALIDKVNTENKNELELLKLRLLLKMKDIYTGAAPLSLNKEASQS